MAHNKFYFLHPDAQRRNLKPNRALWCAAHFLHGAELAVTIRTGGRDIIAKDAASHIFGFACGNDLTHRDLQAVSKSQRRPSDMSKVFDESAVIDAIIPGQSISPDAAIRCGVDGRLRQNAKLET